MACSQCGSGWTPARQFLSAITHVLTAAAETAFDQKIGYRAHPYASSLMEMHALTRHPGEDIIELVGGLTGGTMRTFGETLSFDSMARHAMEEAIIRAAGLDPDQWGVCVNCYPDGIAESDTDEENA